MSWVQKQRKASLFDQRMERHKLGSRGRGRGCFIGIPSAGEGVEFSRGRSSREAGAGAGAAAPHHSAHVARHLHLEWGCRVQSYCIRSSSHPQLEHWHSHFTPGTPVWSAGCEASARSTLWASESRLSTKAKKVRLYFTTQILFLFPGNS